MRLFEVKFNLSRYGNTIICKKSLAKHPEILDFIKEIDGRIEEDFCKKGNICKISGYYDMTDEDVASELEAQKKPVMSKSDYLEIIDKAKRKHRKLMQASDFSRTKIIMGKL